MAFFTSMVRQPSAFVSAGAQFSSRRFENECRKVDSAEWLEFAADLAEVDLAVLRAPVVKLSHDSRALDRHEYDRRTAATHVKFAANQRDRLLISSTHAGPQHVQRGMQRRRQ